MTDKPATNELLESWAELAREHKHPRNPLAPSWSPGIILALIARIEQEQKRVRDALNMSKGYCVWCDEIVPDAAAMKEHSAACPSHPLQAEIERLELVIGANKTSHDFTRAQLKAVREAIEMCLDNWEQQERNAIEQEMSNHTLSMVLAVYSACATDLRAALAEMEGDDD